VVLKSSEEPLEDPVPRERWQTEESWQLMSNSPVYLFGQVGAGWNATAEGERNLVSQTGLAWKVAAWPVGDVVFRSGPKVTYADSRRNEGQRERSELLLEMQYRCPLPGRVNVEYLSSAVPAFTPLEKDRVDQDLRLAFPLGRGGQLRLGAKHSWENLGVPKPWTDSMQFYLGLALGK
jgi:hypothetical protein